MSIADLGVAHADREKRNLGAAALAPKSKAQCHLHPALRQQEA
jgi:hypothetical protein